MSQIALVLKTSRSALVFKTSCFSSVYFFYKECVCTSSENHFVKTINTDEDHFVKTINTDEDHFVKTINTDEDHFVKTINTDEDKWVKSSHLPNKVPLKRGIIVVSFKALQAVVDQLFDAESENGQGDIIASSADQAIIKSVC